MLRLCIVAFAACGLLVGPLFAKPGIVKTKSKQTYEGDVVEKDTGVEINIRGVKMTVAHDQVESIEYTGNIEQQFNDRLAKLDAKDAKGRIELARWAFDRGQYKLARQALEQALQIEPKNAEAATFLDTVIRQERLAAVAGNGGDTPRPPVATQQANVPPTDRRLLSADEINVIRLMELRETDRVSVQIPPDVRNRYATLTNQDRERIVAMPAVRLAIDIRDNPDAQDLRHDIKVQGDPAALADYRRIQPVVFGGCAATGCHSGNTGGSFVLFTQPDNDAVRYTNFYILSEYSKKLEGTGTGGAFTGGAVHRMIDRDQPANSLLLQYGLPDTIAQYDHPAVANLHAPFNSRQHAHYRQALDWITNSLTRPAPDYGLDYKLPSAASQPASRPAPE